MILPRGLRQRRSRCSRCRRDDKLTAAHACAVAATSVRAVDCHPVPAVVNGLMTGAVYALIALGLTLIYGVLHIINFAHGALLSARCSRRSCLQKRSASIPISRVVCAGAGVLRARLRAAALRHRPGLARQGRQHAAGDARPRRRHRERAAVRLSRRHAHRSTCRTPSRPSTSGVTFLPVPRAGRASSRCFVVALGAVADHELHRYRQARSARSPRRSSAPSSPASTSRISMPMTFGLGTACVAHRGLLADSDLLRQSAGRAMPSCWSPSPSWCSAAWARCRAR